MYAVRIGDAWLHDPHTTTVLTSATIAVSAGELASLEMTVPRGHPEAATLTVRDASRLVTVWDGERCLFEGYVWEVREDKTGDLRVACRGGLAWLCDTTVPPYSTVEGEAANVAPADPAALLAWYVECHNKRVGPEGRYRLGTNDGRLLDPNAHIYRASSQRPTTYDEVRDKLLEPLGGVLLSTWDGSERRLDWHAECAGASTQLIDFGENLADYLRTDAADGMATALVAVGGTPEGADSPVTLDSLPDGPIEGRAGLCKAGGAVYDERAVLAHGWVEAVHQSEALTQAGLLASAAGALSDVSSPSVTVEVRAVDMALYRTDADPLVPGRYVRVRSRPHGLDEYLLVSGVELDLGDPSRSTYVLGRPQGTYAEQLRRLNASINASADAVAAISDAAKAAAVDAEAAREAAEAAGDLAVLSLSSDMGVTFRRNTASTTLRARVFKSGVPALDTIEAVRSEFGADAYVQWRMRHEGGSWTTLSSSDPRLSAGGMALSVTPADVDIKTSFEASLMRAGG